MRFKFLNREERIEAANWKVPHQSLLWRYNLHYFDFLFPLDDLPDNTALELIEDWVINNPPGTAVAWAPYPLSLRLVNWIKYCFSRPAVVEKRPTIVQSIFEQTLWLEKNLEYHLLGNHLFKNIKALLFAGLFFKGEVAQRWLKISNSLIAYELEEQILPDGGHFERSPMYHAMLLEDVLDLINILPETEKGLHALCQQLQKQAPRMLDFLCAMTHPDGQIALFNDSAIGIEHTTNRLRHYFNCLSDDSNAIPAPTTLQSFPHTGYFIMSPSQGNRLFVDCGRIGPDYQPGHSHCDTLSFELSLEGRRVVVDSGCCQYEDGAIRQYNRGNAGHNTVTIDGENQSEVWGAHRCARRAYPTLEIFKEDSDGTLVFIGSHDGYRRLPGHPVHQRTIRWQDRLIDITDRILGKGHHRIHSTLHLHPDLDLCVAGTTATVADASGPIADIRTTNGQKLAVLDGWYCPEFNRQLACKKLAIDLEAALPVEIGWRIYLL
jgi:uncharacterized heparinase superfamily protein